MMFRLFMLTVSAGFAALGLAYFAYSVLVLNDWETGAAALIFCAAVSGFFSVSD